MQRERRPCEYLRRDRHSYVDDDYHDILDNDDAASDFNQRRNGGARWRRCGYP